MNLGDLRTAIKNSLFENNIHRSDSFITTAINEGYALVCMFSLCDERRTSTSIDGTRNYFALPTSGDAYCLAPILLVDESTGYRLGPARIDQFELDRAEWEGKVDSGASYYVLQSPFHNAFASVVVCPISNLGEARFQLVGAFIPTALSASTDEPRIEEDFQDLLFIYGRFYGLITETDKLEEAVTEYRLFITRLNEFIAHIRSRFPSGRDFEPVPIEFAYELITTKEQEPPQPTQEQENAG